MQNITVPIDTRQAYWRYFIERWAVFNEGGGHGVTGPKLRKIYNIIMHDDAFWLDVVIRHGNFDSPDAMRNGNEECYVHCLGNFWGMIYHTLVEHGAIR